MLYHQLYSVCTLKQHLAVNLDQTVTVTAAVTVAPVAPILIMYETKCYTGGFALPAGPHDPDVSVVSTLFKRKNFSSTE